jgi:hypothetical protein
LLPRRPCRTCFRPAAPMGFSLRSIGPRLRLPYVPARACPACRYSRTRFDEPKFGEAAAWRPTSGYCLGRVPPDKAGCLARFIGGGSRGFRPFQGYWMLAWAGISASLLPRAWMSHRLPAAASLRLGVSIGEQLARPRGPDTPLRVLHLSDPGIWYFRFPGLFCSPCTSAKRCRLVRACSLGIA